MTKRDFVKTFRNVAKDYRFSNVKGQLIGTGRQARTKYNPVTAVCMEVTGSYFAPQSSLGAAQKLKLYPTTLDEVVNASNGEQNEMFDELVKAI